MDGEQSIQTALVIIGMIFATLGASGVPTGRFDATAASLAAFLASQLVHLL
jgi:hypothetical protein